MSKSLKLAGFAAASIFAATVTAHAGAFALREQSAEAMGSAFAGVAAGNGSLSAMFWNPATLTKTSGLQFSLIASGIIPYANMTDSTGAKSGDVGLNAVVPAGYVSYQFNDKIWLGLGLNVPFGLGTMAPTDWSASGRYYNRTSELRAINVNPTLAYKITDDLSVGLGVQIQRTNVRMNNAWVGGAAPWKDPTLTSELRGYDPLSYGFTGGVTYKLLKGTEIGFGYRSKMTPGLNGDAFTFDVASGALTVDTPIRAKITMPDTFTAGIRHELTSDVALLGGVEFTRWSVWRLFPVIVKSSNGLLKNLVFNYHDAWMVSLGAEYKWNANWMLRAGTAFEKSPVQNDNRSARIPDGDRVWATLGATYKLDDRLSFDASYAHLFVRNGKINQTDYVNAPFLIAAFSADVKARTDIISIGLNYKLGAEPKKTNKALTVK
jgi:long-chain fatty acid transport protein